MKTIFFDLDGTLTPHTTWYEFNKLLGITDQEDKMLFDQYIDHNLTYRDWIKELVRIHASRGTVNKDDIIALAQSIEFRADALSTILELQAKGFHIVLLSGSVDTLVEVIAHTLGIEDWFACSQLVFIDNVLTGIVSMGDEAPAKVVLATTYMKEKELTLDEVCTVGDGGNEIELFKIMKDILLGSNPNLQSIAWKQVETLSEIVDLIK